MAKPLPSGLPVDINRHLCERITLAMDDTIDTCRRAGLEEPMTAAILLASTVQVAVVLALTRGIEEGVVVDTWRKEYRKMKRRMQT